MIIGPIEAIQEFTFKIIMKKYKKKIILFPAGASGNFLAAFLTTGAVFVIPQYRLDLGQLISNSIFVPSDLAKIKNTIINDTHQTIIITINLSNRQTILNKYILDDFEESTANL